MTGKKRNPLLKEHQVGVRKEHIDYDYVNKLNSDEKEYLAKFTDEYYGGAFSKDENDDYSVDNIMKTSKERKDAYKRNNLMNKCAYGISKLNKRLDSVFHENGTLDMDEKALDPLYLSLYQETLPTELTYDSQQEQLPLLFQIAEKTICDISIQNPIDSIDKIAYTVKCKINKSECHASMTQFKKFVVKTLKKYNLFKKSIRFSHFIKEVTLTKKKLTRQEAIFAKRRCIALLECGNFLDALEILNAVCLSKEVLKNSTKN